MKCQNCSNEFESGLSNCPHCGAPVENVVQDETVASKPAFPMKYYKLLTFILFLPIILSLSNIVGIRDNFSIKKELNEAFKSAPEELADHILEEVPELSTLQIVYSVSSVLLGVFAIVVRFALVKKKKISLPLLCTLRVLQGLVSVLYAYFFWMLLDGHQFYHGFYLYYIESLDHSALVAAVVPVALIIMAEIKYFTKRKEIFVN